MATASRSLATALLEGALRERLAAPRFCASQQKLAANDRFGSKTGLAPADDKISASSGASSAWRCTFARRMLRSVVTALSDPSRESETRAMLRERFGGSRATGFKALLVSAPLEGIDLSRQRDFGRDVEL